MQEREERRSRDGGLLLVVCGESVHAGRRIARIEAVSDSRWTARSCPHLDVFGRRRRRCPTPRYALANRSGSSTAVKFCAAMDAASTRSAPEPLVALWVPRPG